MPQDRLMPRPVDLGRLYHSVMLQPISQFENQETKPNPHGLRMVMGFFLPKWQRGLVWTDEQSIRFIESAWRGLNLGTYTYNQTFGEFDNLLIDGQQRMNALERYITNQFKVFGYYWSEITVTDRRAFKMNTIFASYVTQTDDEKYLKDYYNLTNFGGTAHKEDERAI